MGTARPAVDHHPDKVGPQSPGAPGASADRLAGLPLGWRQILLGTDLIACVTLFFAAGWRNEIKFLENETAAHYHWDEEIIDLLGLAALRVVAIWCFLWAAELAAATYELNSPASGWLRYQVAAGLLAFASLGYSSARVVLHYRRPGRMLIGVPEIGEALLICSVVFSACNLAASATIGQKLRRTRRAAKYQARVAKHAIVNADRPGDVYEDDDSDDELLGSVDPGKEKQRAKGKASMRRLVSLAQPEYPMIALGMVMLAFSSASAVAAPLFFGAVVDAANPIHHDRKRLNDAVLTLGCVYIAGALASFLRSWLFTLAGQRVVARVRGDVFAAITRQEIGFFDVTRTGELTNRLASDTAVIQNACTVNLSMLARYIAQIIGSIAIMLRVNTKLTAVLLSVVPAVAIIAVFYGKKVKQLRKQFQDALAEASTVAEESISSIRTVRSFANESTACREYHKSVHDSYLVGAFLAMVQGGFAGVTTALASAAILMVLWYGGTLVLSSQLTTGGLTAFMLYTLTVAMAFAFLSSLYGDFMQALGASVRLFELLDRKPEMDTSGTMRKDSGGAAVTLESVDFSYPSRPDSKVLSGLSLEVGEGRVVALVGPSGGGKSTVVALLSRLYDPTAGRVLLDGTPLVDLDPVWLRNQMAIVSQEPDLFACSIADNIRYGRAGASMDEVEAAARKANAHSFITGFDEGYNTMVGERGVRLSGGQKQRVAIARALICNPRILLLDEATSALDAESEHLVQEAVDRAMQNRTVVVIAHRLSTVRGADQVLVIDSGKIAERGTHAVRGSAAHVYNWRKDYLKMELIELGGVYKRLVARQLLGSQPQDDATTDNGAS